MTNIFEKENIKKSIDDEINNIVMHDKKKINKKILVLSAGDIKGISHLGVMKALEDLNILKDIYTIAGSSMGSIIGLLYVIGYTIDELYNFILLFDMQKMQSFEPINFLHKYGLDNGDKLKILLIKLMKKKNIDDNITFEQLYKQTGINFIVTTTCLNKKKAVYFNHKEHPNMEVLLSVLMSSCVPIYFTPLLFEKNMYIDGAVLDAYPISLFKDNLDETIGVFIKCSSNENNINNFEDYLFSLCEAINEGINKNALTGFEKYTITIELNNIHSLKFDITSDIKKQIYDEGYNKTINFFKF
jgi:predicted acylesterase/phospholipase RssA